MRLDEFEVQPQYVTRSDLKNLEAYLDELYARNKIDFEFTRHFLDRVNDPRNGKQITVDELRKMLSATQQAYGNKLAKAGPDFEAVFKDVSSKINTPFVLDWNPQTEMLELHTKTVMRKDNFRTSSPVLPVKTETLEKKLVEFKMRVERDLARLEGFRDLGMLNGEYKNLSEEMTSLRQMLETLTIEAFKGEFQQKLSEMSSTETNVYQIALSRMNELQQNQTQLQSRLQDAVSKSAKMKEEMLLAKRNSLQSQPQQQPSQKQQVLDKMEALKQKINVKRSKNPAKR